MAQTNDTQQNPNALSTAVYDFSRDALTPQASKLGMTPSQFSAQQTAIMQEDVRQASIQNPGRVVQGAQTGKLSDGTAQYYQNYTTPNQNPAPIVPINNPTTLPITVPNGPKFTSLDGGQTYQKTPIPGGKSTITADVGSGDATALSSSLDRQQAALDAQQAARVAELEQEQKANERSINNVYANRQNTLESQQIEQQKTQDVLSYRLGRKDTMYGVAEMSNLKRDQALAMNQLATEQASLIQQSRAALSQGKFELANQFEDKARNLYQQTYQQQQLAFQKQTQLREEQKYVTEQGKDVFNMMALAGKQPSQELYDWYDSSIGVQGIGQSIFEAASAEMQRKSITDAQTAQKADIDMANSLMTVLQKIPQGQEIKIGDSIYTGLDRGETKTGTEVDARGNVTFWEYDEKTKQIKTTPMGPIGKPQDGWTNIQTDQGFFSYNTKTNQYVPLQPSMAQSTWGTLFPDGSQSPFRNASDPMQGQCASFTNDLYGQRILGDSFEQKKSVLSKYQVDPKEVQEGDTFLMSAGTTGHVGIVSGVKQAPDCKTVLTFLVSNYVPPGGRVISNTRTMNSDDPRLKMFARVPTPNLPPAGPDSPATSAAVSPGGLTIGGKPVSQMFTTPEEAKPLTYSELKDINATLPPEKRLQLGATQKDANAAGFFPSPESKTSATTTTPAAAAETYKVPSFEEFARQREQKSLETGAPGVTNTQLRSEYEQEKTYRTSIKQTFDAIKRGKMTIAERAEFTNQATEALKNNDVDQLENIATQVALKGMSQKQQDAYQSSLNLVETYNSGLDLLGDLANDQNFIKDTGSIKSFIEQQKKKFGANVDPRYAQLDQLLGTFQSDYRNNLYGASLTPQEMSEANKVLANISEATPEDLWNKMSQGIKIQQFAADARVATALGMPRPKLADYLSQE